MELTIVIILLAVVLIIFIALNNVTSSNTNTDSSSVQSNCTQTQYGCCPDGINSKINQDKQNEQKNKRTYTC